MAKSKASMVHPERLQDPFVHKFSKRFPAELLHQRLGNSEAIVAIHGMGTWIVFEHRFGQHPQRLLHIPVNGFGCEPVVEIRSWETRGVVEQHPHGDRTIAFVGHAETLEHLCHRLIQTQAAFLNQHEHRCSSEHLAD